MFVLNLQTTVSIERCTITYSFKEPNGEHEQMGHTACDCTTCCGQSHDERLHTLIVNL